MRQHLFKTVISITLTTILFISVFSSNCLALSNNLSNFDATPKPIVKKPEIAATIYESPANNEAEEFLQELQINPNSENLGVMPSPFAISGTTLTSKIQ